MFGRDAVTNLSQLTKPKLGYMGTEDLILDLELMSSIFQTQIHNLRMARERVIEGQQPVKKAQYRSRRPCIGKRSHK